MDISDQRPIVPVIVLQHADDAAMLHAQRSLLIRAPHSRLLNLVRFDDRLAAHLDALSIAGERVWPMLDALLESPSAHSLFVTTVRAIEARLWDRLDRLVAIAEQVPEVQPGMRSAFGWLKPSFLREVVAELLASKHPLRRAMGTAASAMHRVDPGIITMRRLEDPDPLVRARVLRCAGELGRVELVSTIAAAVTDEDSDCQSWAAWSAVLLGDRQNALHMLRAKALAEGLLQPKMLQLSLQAMPVAEAHALLQQIARNPANQRKLIQGAGLIGDPSYIPWLIGHMADDKWTRLAGESFSMITGADLALLDLERKPPENVEAGPNDDPDDPNVDMDADDGLPWPEQARVQQWWSIHGARFTAGTRHFIGSPLSREHCIDVLKHGYQRQRIAAACHLCLLRPGTPLFEWRAPAWRQQQELLQMK